jgi:cytochrome b561
MSQFSHALVLYRFLGYIVGMYFVSIRRIAAHVVFTLGVLLMFLGNAFLFGNMAGTSGVSVLWAFCVVIIGFGCAVLAIKLNKRPVYLFFAAFFILVGFFLFLAVMRIIPMTFSQAWPLFSIFSGLALFPAAWCRYGIFRVRYVVPSVGFVILGFLLLIFSFRIVPFSFAQFILHWWPLLVVLGGFLLGLIALSTKKKGEDTN